MTDINKLRDAVEKLSASVLTCDINGGPVDELIPKWRVLETIDEFRAALAEAKQGAPTECTDCHGTGLVCVGHSGQDSDGNAPEYERCDSCGGYGLAYQPPVSEPAEHPLQKLLHEQESLGPEFSKVLQDNLWELYSRSTPAEQQGEQEPCKGRNCGSTNYWLHSAECFAEHEASIGSIEPDYWMSTNVLTGKSRIDKVPIVALQPGLYKHTKLYTHPDRVKAEPLTEEQIRSINNRVASEFQDAFSYARAIEAAHGIGVQQEGE